MLIEQIFAFLSGNWGNVASVLGALLTVFFAYGARNAAEAAKTASLNARSRINAIDWVIFLGEIVSQIDDIMSRISTESEYKRVSDDCAKLRSKVAVCLSDKFPVSDDRIKKRIQKSSTFIAAITSQIDIFQSEPENKIDIPKIRKVLSDQRELYSMALNDAKQKAMENGRD